MRIKLSEWARREGISFITAKRWVLAGRVEGAFKNATERWYVDITDQSVAGKRVVLYGRVSSTEQRDDLQRQMSRLRDFVAARGLSVSSEVSDIGSGLNGHRKKLGVLLRDPEVGTIVVEHRDRLARFGVEYIEAALAAQGRTILVINEGEQKLDIVQDFVDVVTSMCARIYGRRASSNRAKAAIAAAESVGPAS
jgi:predicted site-specific integrase-resolvase